MTEEQWLEGNNTLAMLLHPEVRPTARQMRLLICACLRSPEVWPLLLSKSSRRAVEVSEAYADGHADANALGMALKNAHGAWSRAGGSVNGCYYAAGLAYSACYQDRRLSDSAEPTSHLLWFVRHSNKALPAGLVRDVLGNPFRRPTFDAAWRTETVCPLALAAYEERALPAGTIDPLRLSILADALEESGGDGAEVLAHLRSSETHVRGCWVLDLLLGRR